MEFEVSVVIPVYNAKNYLSKAVESAISLKEVAEVILVEDASPDNALELCLLLESKYEKVKLFQHPDMGNHGAGASRNLGIRKATFPFIAFLDADDYYLSNRFKRDKELFSTFSDCDGVYNAVGTDFATDSDKKRFYEAGFAYQEVLTLSSVVEPDILFTTLFGKNKAANGQFHTNGITVKTQFLSKIGLFNEELRLKQDIHLWRRMAAYGLLYAGEINTPVSNRVIHSQNRMTKKADHATYIELWWQSLKDQFTIDPISPEKQQVFFQCYFDYKIKTSNKLLGTFYLFLNCLRYPSVIFESYGDFDFNFWTVFGQNKITERMISFKNSLLKH